MKVIYFFTKSVTTYEGERFKHSSLPRGARGNDTFSDTKYFVSIRINPDLGNGYGYGESAMYIPVDLPNDMDVPMFEGYLSRGEYWSHHPHPESDPRAEEIYLASKKIADDIDQKRKDFIHSNGGTDISTHWIYVEFSFNGKKIKTQLSKIDACFDKPSKFKHILDGMDFLIM